MKQISLPKSSFSVVDLDTPKIPCLFLLTRDATHLFFVVRCLSFKSYANLVIVTFWSLGFLGPALDGDVAIEAWYGTTTVLTCRTRGFNVACCGGDGFCFFFIQTLGVFSHPNLAKKEIWRKLAIDQIRHPPPIQRSCGFIPFRPILLQ